MKDYIPQAQQQMAHWARNLVTLLVAQPGRYSITADQAQNARFLVDAFIASLTVALDIPTRTRQNIMQKEEHRAAMLDLLRPLCQQIKQNRGVAPSDKLALGIAVPHTTRTAIAAPTSAPVLQIVGASPLQHTLRYFDANTPARRAKPEGTTALQLFGIVSDTAPLGPGAGQLLALVTHQPFAVDFSEADAGKTAYYWARWQTRRGLVGPFGAMVRMTVAQ